MSIPEVDIKPYETDMVALFKKNTSKKIDFSKTYLKMHLKTNTPLLFRDIMVLVQQLAFDIYDKEIKYRYLKNINIPTKHWSEWRNMNELRSGMP